MRDVICLENKDHKYRIREDKETVIIEEYRDLEPIFSDVMVCWLPVASINKHDGEVVGDEYWNDPARVLLLLLAEKGMISLPK